MYLSGGYQFTNKIKIKKYFNYIILEEKVVVFKIYLIVDEYLT
jgi:hypothetical protein